MKRTLAVFIAIAATTIAWAQSPEAISYQAVIRNSSDQLIANTQVGMQISILQGSVDGTPVYTEIQTPTTNANGLVSVEIGTGTTSDDFSAIDWSSGTYFIKTETDPAGSTGYSISGTSQLLSVPFAFHAKTAENITNAAIGNKIGDLQYWNGTDWAILEVGQSGQQLQINDSSIPTWVGSSASISTLSMANVTGVSANGGGHISSDGGAMITSRGICWSTSPNPTIDDSKTVDGSGSGSFISSLTGLTEGSTYHVRAYAINSFGVAYGNNVEFVTKSLATITTSEASSISNTSIRTGGTISSDGGDYVTTRGICWNTSTNPTINDNVSSSGSGIGSFESTISNLTIGTNYYIRAFATNSIGTKYGNEITATTTSIVVPTVATVEATSITDVSAVSGGNIASDGGAPVSEKGVCWSTAPNPTTDDFKTQDGSESGVFSSSISGLSPNSAYYIRAYATNTEGTSYGNETSFTTIPSLPELSTKSAAVEGTTVILGGIITNDGGANVTERGVCWSTSPNPTIADNVTSDGNGDGEYLSQIIGLTLGDTYYSRAFATNSSGTAYGNEVRFTALEIGQSFQGGIIAYIYQPNDAEFDSTNTHGIVTSATDLSTGIQWYNGTYVPTGANARWIGSGDDNTNAILLSQFSGDYAAKICFDLVLDGYSDWYLPSLEELRVLYINRNSIGGFALTKHYWTSTEYNLSQAYTIFFYTGSESLLSKNDTSRYVRPIRYF